ncbi:hypothetical protein Tco_0543480 [Tanacetum coccineum]
MGQNLKTGLCLNSVGKRVIKTGVSIDKNSSAKWGCEENDRTLIEAALGIMLADSHLPTTFWAEAVNTACYTFNRKELDSLALKHLGPVHDITAATKEVFSDADDDEMPEIRIYDKSSEGIFEQASFDDDGIITDFNNLPVGEMSLPTHSEDTQC